MNTKRLKIIAIISMFIDHIPRIIPWQMWIAIADSLAILFPGKEELVSEIVIDRVPGIMGYVGRLAAPIFMFCITVGFRYTKDIKKYILRVFTFAFISQIPYILFMQSEEYASGFSKLEVTPFYKIDLNIMFTLGLGLVALYFYEKLKDKNIMIILCGSLISMMYSETLAYESPLHGRRTAQIKLQPIKFKYYSEFFKNKSIQNLIELYSITGGVPKYILSLDRNKSALYNIENNIFDKNNYLYSEPKFLLQEEVNDLSRYFSILNAISIGHTKMSAISSYLQINAGGLSPYISKLIDLDILEKEVPITEDIENTKKVLYKIKDNYLKFWFSYVYPYQSYFEIENLTYIKNKIESEFDLYVSKIYEDLARESIWENIEFPLFKVGRWWDKNTEIDIVALGKNNKIVFGECKYSKKSMGLNILKELKDKSKKVIWNNDKREEYYILFSKSGFSKDLIELTKKESNIILKELV